jgi:hypothetical protein
MLKKLLRRWLYEPHRGGRPNKQAVVEAYFAANPAATVRGAASALGIATATVQRWRPRPR